MLTSIRGLRAANTRTVRLLTAGILAGPALMAVPALAQDTAPPAAVEISGNVAVVSDYRFRGVSLSGGDAAIQGGIDVATASGFYVGTWGSSIDGGPDYGDVELDLYAGYGGQITEAVGFDVGILYYMYPSSDTGADVDYWEPYASVSTTLGPAEATLGAAYAWEQDSLGGSDNLYVYTDVGVGIPTTPVTVSAHLGYTDGVLAPPLLAGALDDTGFDYSIGATATVLGGLEVGVAYVGVDGPSIDGFTDDTIVGTLGFSF